MANVPTAQDILIDRNVSQNAPNMLEYSVDLESDLISESSAQRDFYLVLMDGLQNNSTIDYDYFEDRSVFDEFLDVTPVPAPAALWLLGSGILVIIGRHRNKMK